MSLDKAFTWLEKPLEARSAGLIYLGVDPAYDSIREDPRFVELLRKVGRRKAESLSGSLPRVQGLQWPAEFDGVLSCHIHPQQPPGLGLLGDAVLRVLGRVIAS